MVSSPFHWPASTCVASFPINQNALAEIDRASKYRFDGPTSEESKILGRELWDSIRDSSPLFSHDDPDWLGLSQRPSGLRTSTFDVNTGLRIGFHLDSWDRIALNQRNFTRNRLCINLGSRTRSLLFVPADIGSVLHALSNDSAVHSANIGERFCRRFPSAPVLELEIPPGHAYLAPTENIIHDGHSDPSPAPDLTIAWIGHIAHSGRFY